LFYEDLLCRCPNSDLYTLEMLMRRTMSSYEGTCDMGRSISSTLLIIAACLLSTAASVYSEAEVKTGTIVGRVAMIGKGPIMDGTVTFYDAASGPPPSATMYWRVPTYAVGADNNARFVANLPEGKYYIGAIDKPLEEAMGPLSEGELFYVSTDGRGTSLQYKVKKGKIVDVEVIEATPFHCSMQVKKGMTAIQGTVRKEKGGPIEGMTVFAYSKQSMAGQPLFVSERTDKDGRYQLRVPGSGAYYLRARKNYAGPLSPDELVGTFKNGKPVTVKKAATQKGIDIVVRKAGELPPKP
jgi:hypothetical protein